MSIPSEEGLDLPDLVDAGDLAVGELGNLRIERGPFPFGDISCGAGKCHIAEEATLINDDVDLPHDLFCWRQRRQNSG